MASNIVSESIDAAFPVAGQDNDSQGFRDNFSIIKDSLASAKQEVEDLQLNTAKLNEANNFAGNNVIDANLKAVTEEFYIPSGDLQNSQNINFDNGHYQSFGVNGNNLVLTFDNWPASGTLGRVRVELALSADAQGTQLISFATTDSNGGTGILKYSNWGAGGSNDGGTAEQVVVDSETDPVVLEFWTTDGGATVYANYIGQFAEI